MSDLESQTKKPGLENTSIGPLRHFLLHLRVAIRHFFRRRGWAKVMLSGYLFYMMLGWALLCLPVASVTPASALDHLFIAVSAVSTTGLATVDPGTTYSLFGEIVILILIQLGGLGYMTFGSFVALSMAHRLSPYRATILRATFPMPDDFNPGEFIWRVVMFSLAVEVIGAAILFAFFTGEGVENALWPAIFHSVSAFCTAGFSLYATSFVAFADHTGIVLTISALSYLGAIGFIVMSELYDVTARRKTGLRFTTRVILTVTVYFAVFGTFLFFLAEPSIAGYAPYERLLAAFFQVMTATTTVGFNTVPIDAVSGATILLLYGLMMFGASPSGTGGGLKSTTLATLWGTMRSVLKQRPRPCLMGRELPPERIHQATASLAYYIFALSVAMFLLLLTETGSFDIILFEAISALGTVGLSMGLTSSLTEMGKLIIIVLMIIGRVGILTFGIAIATRDMREGVAADNELVM